MDEFWVPGWDPGSRYVQLRTYLRRDEERREGEVNVVGGEVDLDRCASFFLSFRV